MRLTHEEVRRLARITLRTRPGEVSCDEWIHLVAEYVEVRRNNGGAVPEHLVVVERHVEECRACGEELEALGRLLDGERSPG